MSTQDGAPRAGSRRATVRPREDAVVARLQALAPDLDDGPDPAFRAATRDRLVAMAAVRSPEPAPRSRLRRLFARADDAPAPVWRTRLTAGLAGAALTAIAAGTLVALARDARPGDVLYDLKRGTEQTRLALAGDDRGLTLLEFAQTRLAELGTLPDPAAADVVDLLDTMDAQTTEGAALLAAQAVGGRDAAPVDDLAGWAERQSAGLAALQPEVPTGATDAAQGSLTLLTRVSDRASGLRVALSCPAGPATSGVDDLGPLPAACPGPGSAAGETPGDPGVPPSGATLSAGAGPAPGPGLEQSGAPAPVPAPGAPTADAPAGGPPPVRGSGGAPATVPPPAVGGRPATPTVPQVRTGDPPPVTVPLPAPLPPVPVNPSLPSQPSPRPPILDTPLPICIRPLVC